MFLTPSRKSLFEALLALGLGSIPAFGHLPLIYDKDGGKLSKRSDSLSLEACAEAHRASGGSRLHGLPRHGDNP